MLRPALILSAAVVLAMVLAGCTQPDEAAYPRLLPLSELNQPPAIPAHAADAAADPQAVGDALKARRAEAQSRAAAVSRPVTDQAALSARAADLRRRADALSATALPPSAANPAAVSPAPADPATSDPGTAARVRALQERARSLSERPAPAAGPLPPCPPDTADPVAAQCNPG